MNRNPTRYAAACRNPVASDQRSTGSSPATPTAGDAFAQLSRVQLPIPSDTAPERQDRVDSLLDPGIVVTHEHTYDTSATISAHGPGSAKNQQEPPGGPCRELATTGLAFSLLPIQ